MVIGDARDRSVIRSGQLKNWKYTLVRISPLPSLIFCGQGLYPVKNCILHNICVFFIFAQTNISRIALEKKRTVVCKVIFCVFTQF
jgi:hypothetical protein